MPVRGVRSTPAITYSSDSDSCSDADTVSNCNTPKRDVVVVAAPTSNKVWIASLILGTLGIALGVTADVLHQLNFIDMKSTMWLFGASGSMIFAAGCISAAKKYLKTAGIFFIISGALLCLSSDLAHPGGLLDTKVSLSLDSTGACLLIVGVISLVIHRRLRNHQKKIEAEKARSEAEKARLFAEKRDQMRKKIRVSQADIARVVKSSSNHGITPLHEAARAVDSITLKRSLDLGADPNAKTVLGTTPLQIALLDKLPDAALTLLRDRRTTVQGGDPIHQAYFQYAHCEDRSSKEKWQEVIKLLIQRGAPLAYKDANGNNILHLALFFKFNDETIMAILKRDSTLVSQYNKENQTPRAWVLKNGTPNLKHIFMVLK